ncbi:MAG TPA: hypothetical protein VFV41_01045 [Streptosporangiaceae bacterium]|nr:hypothetical protein [Streptosporangiaceae bacterium]
MTTWEELSARAEADLGDRRHDISAVLDAIYAERLPLIGMTREAASARIRAALGDQPASIAGLRDIAAVLGLSVRMPGQGEFSGPDETCSGQSDRG